MYKCFLFLPSPPAFALVSEDVKKEAKQSKVLILNQIYSCGLRFVCAFFNGSYNDYIFQRINEMFNSTLFLNPQQQLTDSLCLKKTPFIKARSWFVFILRKKVFGYGARHFEVLTWIL